MSGSPRWKRGRRTAVTLVVLGAIAVAIVVATGAASSAESVRIATAVVGLAIFVLVMSNVPVRRLGPKTATGLLLADRLRRARRRMGKNGHGTTDDGGGGKGVEATVRFSELRESDFRALLQPRLIAVAKRRLEEAGVDPDDPDSVTAALGPTGRLLEVDRPATDRNAAGVDAADVLALLEKVESLR